MQLIKKNAIKMNNLTSLLFKETNCEIRYHIENDEVWICAKDLATPLGKSESVIRNQIRKIPQEWLMSVQRTKPQNGRPLCFINKKGAIKIIMKTRAKQGSMIDRFQNWAVEKLDELLSTGSTSMAVNELQNQLFLKDQEALEYKQNALELKQQLDESEKKTLKLEKVTNDFFEDLELCKDVQRFYIATTRLYAQRNRFKFGGVQSHCDLNKRLSNYNCGKANGDRYYFCKIYNVYNYKTIESTLHSLIPHQLKEGTRKSRYETVKFNYSVFVELVDFVINNMGETHEWFAQNCSRMIRATIHTFDPVPPPVLVKPQVIINCRKNGQNIQINVINLDDLTDAEKLKIVKKFFVDYQSKLQPNQTTVKRQDFEKFVRGKNYVFKCRPLYKICKKVFGATQFSIKY